MHHPDYNHRQPPPFRRHFSKPIDFHPNHYRPPGPPNPTAFQAPNFVLHLRRGRRHLRRDLINSIISQCPSKPQSFSILPYSSDHNYHSRSSSTVDAAILNFLQWVDTLNAVAYLWETRLDGMHDLTPELKSNVMVPSDEDELYSRLRAVFARHVKSLMQEAKELKRWEGESERLTKEIAGMEPQKKNKHYQVGEFFQMNENKKRFEEEKNLVERRVREFRCAMECLLKLLEEKGGVDEERNEGVTGNYYYHDYDYDAVFRFDGRLNWKRVHSIIMRERRRLEEGLPIYAYRRDILHDIHHQQITVLVGETGSGKSTQLVQFLADSGVGAAESIICTQPRKIAARSLAQRVQEESNGCYEGNAINSYSTFSSLNEFDSKITFMTDHCLLQHYMADKNLSGVSCIIVDEAHERSLNTDLLLALIKNLLCRRVEMRLIIMSATADAKQLSEYFYSCRIVHVLGRSFPVDVKYVPSDYAGHSESGIAPYVSDVVRMAIEIHKTEEEGTILAFLTSQIEVEWACDNFEALSAVALPLHGKLLPGEQFHVFQNYPGKRKVIFATNLAETSLTIPGVKYVIDSGLIKDSRYDPGSGMNVLKVCWISQSSANQRAGRAGRTEPGRCYRLYSEADYQCMEQNQEPEIRRVHLGVAVLRILALGVKNVQEFDFVDAPSQSSIEMAIRNLILLGVIQMKNNVIELTNEGRYLVRMGIEPRLGKLILGCLHHTLGREGIVLAALMANASSIFCRVGSEKDKQRSDCLKMQFCHCDGDLFTLLSVYKEWEGLPRERRNQWCWENSINAKSMRRCQDTILELESCLERELNLVVPSYWRWTPQMPAECDMYLKRVILSSLPENVAMYSGCKQLGYEVAQTGQHVQLHPSCSLLVFAQKPSWVVFSELLSHSNQYLVCVSAFDFESLHSLDPPPLFDVCNMEKRKLETRTLSGFCCTLLKKFCGKGNSNLISLVSRIRKICEDERISIEVNVDHNDIQLYATSHDMETAVQYVNEVLECEKKWLRTECIEKCLYHGSGFSPIALFGSGAEIKHLELGKRSLSVDVCHPNTDAIEDKQLLMFLEKNTSASVCSVHKYTCTGRDVEDREKWGRITFLSPDAALRAAELDGEEFCGSPLKISHSQTASGDKSFLFPAVKAKIFWPRRLSKGVAIVKCDIKDVDIMLRDFYNLSIGGRYVRCEPGRKDVDSVVVSGFDKELSDAEILDVVRNATSIRISDFFLIRGDAVGNPPVSACEEALLKEISPFMPKKDPHINSCRVQVFQPEPRDVSMRALITFDGRLHLEAAKALEQIEGKVLPGCLSWQKIKCQRVFHSSLIVPLPVYRVIREELEKILESFSKLKGVECRLEKTSNGSQRLKITANATQTVAEVRRPFEELSRGKRIDHASLTPAVVQLLLSREGFNLKSSLQQETGTYILIDRYNLSVRVFGPPDKVCLAQQKLIQSLLSFHEAKQLEIHLRGRDLPPDLMKQVVKQFGPDLSGLKVKVPGADLVLNIRRQIIYLRGNKELKQKVEEFIFEIVRSSHRAVEGLGTGPSCPICLCEVEDGYLLEGCCHLFCRSCLVDQCESAIRNQGTFPICCAREGCGDPILVTDLKALLLGDKLEELFRASLGSFVASSGGTYRFCPSPDCPSVYRVADPGTAGEPFVCGACYSETCTRCHLEYHPYISCDQYREFKDDPDSSLKAWCSGKEHVKRCPSCGYTIEKVDGCNHIECKCGKHVCWVCLEFFGSSDNCYDHLRNIHMAII
ncbi:ATP-dependent RNA helicase DEAH11, chloroplastic-like [Arachis stenosperma]|uniref:ATP-dependent RNA helicase DEAH11, chloroplastic-like n=1 Tax=Arachis stenosperma TaxID=217475 RepID=UPI0025AD7891|nr:ATP-dependent RNA helicase DEAH11, chloroplastic-like [Arachis stenosperma]